MSRWETMLEFLRAAAEEQGADLLVTESGDETVLELVCQRYRVSVERLPDGRYAVQGCEVTDLQDARDAAAGDILGRIMRSR